MGLAFLSGANPFLFFLERKESKRTSFAGKFFFAAPAAFTNLLHKTDGSYVNRPFFRFKQDVRKSVFSQIDRLSRSVFCFFSSRKENVPFQEKKSYPLEEKEGGKRRPQPTGMGSGSGAGIAVCESFVPRSIDGTFTRQPFG